MPKMGRGAHQAELMGFPATGKPINAAGIEIVRVEGSMLVEHWATIDQLGMLQQIGVVPMPG
jgi:predicted ester cyclase